MRRPLVLLAVVVLVLGVPLAARALVRTHAAGAVEQRIAAAVARGLPSARASAARSSREALSGRSPAYAWTQLECSVDTVDAGLVVQSYGLTCVVASRALVRRDGLPGQCLIDGDATEAYESACPAYVGDPPTSTHDRLLAGRRPPASWTSGSWTLVERSSAVADLDLGCAPLALLGCDWPGR